MKALGFIIAVSFLGLGCGLKVVNPNDKNPNEGALALDYSGGKVSLVGTYTCKLESMGNRFSAMGKTEADARDAVIDKCRSRTLISVCDPEKTKCFKN
ncbi:hypothetical protein ACES2L_11550 [Bdellovibrio bacteriovorus]